MSEQERRTDETDAADEVDITTSRRSQRRSDVEPDIESDPQLGVPSTAAESPADEGTTGDWTAEGGATSEGPASDVEALEVADEERSLTTDEERPVRPDSDAAAEAPDGERPVDDRADDRLGEGPPVPDPERTD